MFIQRSISVLLIMSSLVLGNCNCAGYAAPIRSQATPVNRHSESPTGSPSGSTQAPTESKNNPGYNHFFETYSATRSVNNAGANRATRSNQPETADNDKLPLNHYYVIGSTSASVVELSAKSTAETSQKTDKHKSENPMKKTKTTAQGPAGPLNYATAPKGDRAAARKQLGNVINADFDTWAAWNVTTPANPPTLSLSQIGALLANPDITAAQAAALAALAEHLSDEGGPDPTITLAQAEAIDPVKADETGTESTTGKPDSDFVHNYQMAMNQLGTSVRNNDTFKLYGPSGKPETGDVKQGAFDDCFFLSAVNGVLASQGPKAISSMIKYDGNNTYTVTFPPTPPGTTPNVVTVTLTEGEIADFSVSKNNGVWLPILGLAANSYLKNFNEDGDKNGNKQSSDTPTGYVVNTGYDIATFGLLTGQTYKWMSATNTNSKTGTRSTTGNTFAMHDGTFHASTKETLKDFLGIAAPASVLDQIPGANSNYWSEKTFDEIIQTCMKEHLPVGINAYDGDAYHVLAITGYNPVTHELTIKNPWGSTETYDPVTGDTGKIVKPVASTVKALDGIDKTENIEFTQASKNSDTGNETSTNSTTKNPVQAQSNHPKQGPATAANPQLQKQLYGSNGVPTITGMSQTNHDDCYFYNVLGWYAANDPQAIENMITPEGNNTYKVTFANGNTYTVVLNSSNQPYSTQNQSDGTWIDVLTNAFAQQENESLSQVLHGGQAHTTYGLFTNQPYTGEPLKGQSVKSLYDLLSTTEGQPVGIDTSGHACTVLHFVPDPKDPAESTLQCWNPWGSTGWFDPSDDGFSKTKPKDTKGWVQMTNGNFTITLGQLAKSKHDGFTLLTVPTAAEQSQQPTTTARALPEHILTENSARVTNSVKQEVHRTKGITQTETLDSKPQVGDEVYSLGRGSMLVMRDKDFVLRTDKCDVHIAPHAIAYVINLDSEVGIYDLSDVRGTGVKVDIGGQQIEVGTGKALVITSDGTKGFNDLVLANAVSCSNPKPAGTMSGMTAFTGDFSYQSALNTSPQFAQFINSTEPQERSAANRLLKLLAADEVAQ